jgi:hypothetical protein
MQTVCSVPQEWGVDIDERLVLVGYLVERQHDLLANF